MQYNFLLLFLINILYQNIAFADCGDYIVVPLQDRFEKELIRILNNEDVSFEMDYKPPFNICKDVVTLKIINKKNKLSITRKNETNSPSKINFIIDNSQINDSRYSFYLEIDKKKFKLKNNHEVTLSIGPSCVNDSRWFKNWIYVDKFGFRKFSNGSCPSDSSYYRELKSKPSRY